MLKAITLDMDDTQLNFSEFKQKTARVAAEAMINAGLKDSVDSVVKKIFEVYRTQGWENTKIMSWVLESYNIEDVHLKEKIRQSGILVYEAERGKVLKPFLGVVETLNRLKEMGIKVVVLTDANREKVWKRLILSGLQDMFDAVVCSTDANSAKPDSKIFQLALDKISELLGEEIKPEEVLHVGDHPDKDIEGARKFGMKTCLARSAQWDHSPCKPDYKINDFRELLQIVQDLMTSVRNGKPIPKGPGELHTMIKERRTRRVN